MTCSTMPPTTTSERTTNSMNPEITHVVERLRQSRSVPWLRVIDDARLDQPADEEPDPEAVGPYTWLMRRVGDGVRLTQAGYLPPVLVSEAMAELGWQDQWIGKHNREDQTLPILELRETAQHLGLLRKNRGQLLLTKLARGLVDDPPGLWWHLADRLPVARSEVERQAGALYLLTVAAGRPMDDELLATGMSILGWADSATGRSVSPSAAFGAARDTWATLRRLGLLPAKSLWDYQELPPSGAGIRLARAALLGSAKSVTAVQPTKPSTEPPVTQPVRAGQRMVQLNVGLRNIEPAIWRRLVVPTSLTLRELHSVIQTAMGWQDYHLHLFDVAGVLYGDVEEMQTDALGDEEVFTVGAAADMVREFGYEYDFGDSWEHTVRIEQTMAGVGADTPHLIGGARACPPEDCGGAWGYQHLVDVLADPTDDEHADLGVRVLLRGVRAGPAAEHGRRRVTVPGLRGSRAPGIPAPRRRRPDASGPTG